MLSLLIRLTDKLQFSGDIINKQNVQTVGAAGISFPLRAADFQFLPTALQQETHLI